MRLEQLKFGKPRWILLEIRGVTHKQGHGVNSDTSVSRQTMKSVLSVWLGMKENIHITISPNLHLTASSKRMAILLNIGCSVIERSCYEQMYGMDISPLGCRVSTLVVSGRNGTNAVFIQLGFLYWNKAKVKK